MGIDDGEVVFASGEAHEGHGVDWREFGTVIGKHLIQAGFDLVIERTGEDMSVENPRLVSADEAQLGIDRNVMVHQAIEGIGPFGRRHDNLRGIATLPSYTSQTIGITPVLKADLGIGSYEELIESDAGLVLKSNDYRYHNHGIFFGQVLEAYGSSWDELFERGCRQIVGPDGRVPELDTGEKTIEAMERGELDGGWGLREIWKVAREIDLTFLSLSEEAAATLEEVFGHLIVDVRPDVLFAGQEAFTTWGYPGQFIFTHEAVPDDLVYEVARIINEESLEFAWCQPGIVGVPERHLANTWGYAPLHDGARAYYESLGWL